MQLDVAATPYTPTISQFCLVPQGQNHSACVADGAVCYTLYGVLLKFALQQDFGQAIKAPCVCWSACLSANVSVIILRSSTEQQPDRQALTLQRGRASGTNLAEVGRADRAAMR